MGSMARRCAWLAGALAVFVLAGGPARSVTGTVNADVLYIEHGSGDVPFLVDFLKPYGLTVTDLEDPLGLTLADLAPYDALLISPNSEFTETNNVGDVAKQFADAGHGVVIAEFSFQGPWALGGGIMGPGYSPFTIDPKNTGYWLTSNLGTVYDPASPLFDGVTTANVSMVNQGDVGLSGTLVADWASGRHAIAYNHLANSTVIGLNLFPDEIKTNVDDQRLLANALRFSLTAGGVTPPEPQPVDPTAPEPSSLLMCGASLLTATGFGLRLRRGRPKA